MTSTLTAMANKKFFEKIKEFWPTFRTWFVKTLLKKYLPKIAGGVWGWLLVVIGEYAIDKVGKPAWNYLVRKGFSFTNKLKRKTKAKKLENAKTENDFDDSFDSMP